MALVKIWETFLPIVDLLKTDLASAADPAYLLSKGVEPEAPALLCQLKNAVGPLVRTLDLEWFSFLVHNRESGVPTTEDDRRCYIHLRLKFKEHPAVLDLPPAWQMTREVDLSREIAGVDGAVLDVDRAWAEIGKQSAWLLGFVEALGSDDGLVLVRHVRQFLHFAANQAQMRVA